MARMVRGRERGKITVRLDFYNLKFIIFFHWNTRKKQGANLITRE